MTVQKAITMNRIRWFVLLLPLLWSIQVSAHGYLIRSIPEDRAVLEQAPVRLQYWFSEGLEANFSSIHLRGQDGTILATGGVDPRNDRLLTLRVPSDLAEGAYLVELRPAFSSDSHVIVETRVFFIGAAVDEVSGTSASTLGETLESIWKALLYSGSYLLFGMVILYGFVLVPVWGNDRYPAGLLPPRLMRRLNLLMWCGLGVAIVANLLALLQQTMLFFDVDAVSAIQGGFWQIVRTGSRFGDVWNFRMLALLLAAALQFASQYYAPAYPRMVRSFWAANSWLLALLIGGQAVTSHAAGSLVMPWVAVSVHWLHTLAVAFWTGGIAALALILPVALAPYSGEERWQALRPVMQRFSRYMIAALLLIISSGIYSASNWFYSAADLQTSYGTTLGIKLLLIGLLLAVGALHHVALHPHLLQHSAFQGIVRWGQQFGASLQLEMLLAGAALAAAAALSATPIPQPDIFNQPARELRARSTQGAYDVQAELSPGAPGINTLDLLIRHNGQALSGLAVEAQISNPTRDQRTRWLSAEDAADGLYVLVTDAILSTGTWWSVVEWKAQDGQVMRAAFAWELGADAALQTELPPSALTWLALLMVTGSFGMALFPAWNRLAQRMEWSTTNLVISAGAILITLVAIAGSIWFLQERSAALEQQLNPPPQIINPALPDADSLARGQALLNQSCVAWLTHAALPALIRQLDFIRDEELYQIPENGWRDLPACVNLPADAARWDMVNALRSLRHSASE